jgi:hypothetical protein
MTLRVVPEGLAAPGHARAIPLIIVVVPPAAQAVAELDRHEERVAESGARYATCDGAAASSYLVAGG